jgi:hypothetical protein
MNLSDLRKTLTAVQYKNWRFIPIRVGSQMYLQVAFIAPDSVTKKPAIQRGRKWFVSKHATHSEVIFTALKAVLTAEEHEAREQFLYHGRAIANPHIDVRELWSVAIKTEERI